MTDRTTPNVFLLVVDACRADYLSPYDAAVSRTPSIDALAGEATVFERAVSAAPWTLPSVTSILTGDYPHEHGATARHFEQTGGTTLQAQLSRAGYRCIHVSPKTWIGEWLPQGRGFDVVDEFTGPEHRYFAGGADVRRLSAGVARGPEWYATVARRALRSDAPVRSLGNAVAYQVAEAFGDAWLDDVRASERAAEVVDAHLDALADADQPFFVYVHLMDPHLPFYVPPEFRSAVRPPGCDGDAAEREYMRSLLDDVWAVRLGERRLSPAERRYLRTRYADEVAYADAVVGSMLDGLRRYDLLDDTVVVLTGDHGEHLGEAVDGRTLVDHQCSVRLPVLRVPLLVRYPGVFDAERRDAVVQTNYVAETVRAILGFEYDRSRSLLRADDDARRATAVAEYAGVVPSHPPDWAAGDEWVTASRRTAITDRWKLDAVGDRYRLARIDWATNDDREVDRAAVPADAHRRLIDALPDSPRLEAGDRNAIPADVERRLEELGYR